MLPLALGQPASSAGRRPPRSHPAYAKPRAVSRRAQFGLGHGTSPKAQGARQMDLTFISYVIS